LTNPLREICTVGSVRGTSPMSQGLPKRARSWKRRIQPRKTYSVSGSPLLGNLRERLWLLKKSVFLKTAKISGIENVYPRRERCLLGFAYVQGGGPRCRGHSLHTSRRNTGACFRNRNPAYPGESKFGLVMSGLRRHAINKMLDLPR
jgi:hypothetical protein